jgi:hypothetical protein
MTTTGTTPGAPRFITGATTTEVEKRAAKLAATTADLAATGAEIVPAAMKGTGLPVRTPVGPAGLKTPAPAVRPFEGNNKASRGYAEPRGQSGTRSGAFSNYDHGGQERSFSSRGSASFGGGGGARGGGGRH